MPKARSWSTKLPLLTALMWLIWASFPILGEEQSTKELINKITKTQKAFEALKPAQSEKVDALFPEAMKLLGEAQSILQNDSTRIHAVVGLALATVPFDDSVPAADVLVDDYKKHRSAYEAEITKHQSEEKRNRLLISLRRYANFDPNSPAIVGTKSREKRGR